MNCGTTNSISLRIKITQDDPGPHPIASDQPAPASAQGGVYLLRPERLSADVWPPPAGPLPVQKRYEYLLRCGVSLSQFDEESILRVAKSGLKKFEADLFIPLPSGELVMKAAFGEALLQLILALRPVEPARYRLLPVWFVHLFTESRSASELTSEVASSLINRFYKWNDWQPGPKARPLMPKYQTDAILGEHVRLILPRLHQFRPTPECPVRIVSKTTWAESRDPPPPEYRALYEWGLRLYPMFGDMTTYVCRPEVIELLRPHVHPQALRIIQCPPSGAA